MAKKEIIDIRKIHETNFSITKQIDVNFRSYALYVLENRGIPCFYDALTNVQRISLLNAPKTFSKTISLVGNVIADHYPHGDAALSKAINKMARPYGCAEQLLHGYGFFGSPVKSEPAATRYTFIKANPVISNLMNKYSMLNKKIEDDHWDWIRTELPIGLLTSVVGIAVGYKSMILPRKLEEIQKALDGKKANLNPYFRGFSGKISSYNGMKKTWLIEGVLEINETAKSIRILELPPLMKYDSFIKKKLSKLAESESLNFILENDSTENIDLVLRYKTSIISWEDFKITISKMIKMIVSETIIFIKDSAVVEYDDIADYLSEFIVHREAVRLEKSSYDLREYSHELEFLNARIEYLKFMLVKKRAETEIDNFLSVYNNKIQSRLERTLLRDLSDEGIIKTVKQRDEYVKLIDTEITTENNLRASLHKLKESTQINSKSTKNAKNVDLLFEDQSEIDGIEVFLPEEIVEEENIQEDDE